MTEDTLIEMFARAIAKGEAPALDPEAPFPFEGHANAAPRWHWHVLAAKYLLAGIALSGMFARAPLAP